MEAGLEGIEKILRNGKEYFEKLGQENKFTLALENDNGIEIIENLKMHATY